MLDPAQPSRLPEIQEDPQVFRPLIFGEVLFDHFQDGSKVLGGASFNVAWYLQGFKARSLMVTAVGRDPEGEEVLRQMTGWGMDTSGVQIHPTRPTGRVTALVEGGEAHYDIEAHQAYDAISAERCPSPGELGGIHLLCHGSLAAREGTSARALALLRDALDVPVLLDVNLRAPWWRVETLTEHLRGTEWVKMNREEAGLLAGLPVPDADRILAAAVTLREEHGLGTLVVTLGEEGAMAVDSQGARWCPAPAVQESVDPVGAGDAFSAVLALGLQRGWSLETVLRNATEFAAELCRIRGATTEDPGLYDRHLRRWIDAS